MEYFVGSLITMIATTLLQRMAKKEAVKLVSNKKLLQYNQSRSFELVKPMLPFLEAFMPKPKLNTQASKHLEKSKVRVLVMNNFAYWIKDNSVWKADLEGKEILKETAKKVDTIHMSDVELKEIMFIIDKLTEGRSNDSGYSGKQNL